MFSALDIAKWFLVKNNSERASVADDADGYEVYEGITHLKLQKLLYYADGIYLALNDSPLFQEHILAWKHGPVVREVYNKYKSFGREVISCKFSEEDYNVVNAVESCYPVSEALRLTYDNFAIYTAWQLREMTHKANTPWDITIRQKGAEAVIDNDLIQQYFKDEVIE